MSMAKKYVVVKVTINVRVTQLIRRLFRSLSTCLKAELFVTDLFKKQQAAKQTLPQHHSTMFHIFPQAQCDLKQISTHTGLLVFYHTINGVTYIFNCLLDMIKIEVFNWRLKYLNPRKVTSRDWSKKDYILTMGILNFLKWC